MGASRASSAKESPSVAQHVSSQATNVLQFYRSVIPNVHNGRVQQKWYDSGTEVPWFHRFRDGSFGYGVDQTILNGYAYLAATYEPGDDLYIYGFSVHRARSCGPPHDRRATLDHTAEYHASQAHTGSDHQPIACSRSALSSCPMPY